MNPKLDNETRAYFSKLETLKQLDDLDMVRDTFVGDIVAIFFDTLTTGLVDLARKHPGWEFEKQQSGWHRY